MIQDYTKLRLKVLQGINKGAIATFSSDKLIVGSSPKCDIVLSGFTTSEPRIEISYIDNRLLLKVINKSIALDGVLIQPSERVIALKLYQLISFDTCCLTVGEHGKDWPLCKANTNYIEPPPATNILKTILLSSTLVIKNSSVIERVSILLSLFLVTFVIFIYTIKAKVPEGLDAFNAFSSKQVVVKDFELKSHDQFEDIHSSTIEKLAYGLLQTFGVNRIDLNFQVGGVLIAQGYVGDGIKWEKAKTSILEDIKDIKDIDTSGIETFSQRRIKLNEMLRDKNIRKNLQVSAEEGKDLIFVSGELTHKAAKEWLNIKNNYISSYKNTPKLESKIIDIENKINLLIRSVNVGKTKYFTSKIGKKYMVGSDLGSGFRVLKIDVDKITLSYKGDRISVYYSKDIDKNSNIIY